MLIGDFIEAALRSQANNKYNFRVADSKSVSPNYSSFWLVGDANASRNRLSLYTATYLLLTDFEGRASCKLRPAFFLIDLWPKREARGP